VEKIASEKYNNWDWNYGRFDQFEYNLTERFPIGTINLGLTIKQAKINELSITGDFFGTKNVDEVINALVGVNLKKSYLICVLDIFNLNYYLEKMTKETFINFILSYNE